MSDLMTLPESNLPAHLQNAGHLNEDMGGGLSQSVPRLSIRGGRWRVKRSKEDETTLPGLEIPVVIIGANPNLTKTYYGKDYNPDDSDQKPICSSHDGIKPDAGVEEPQCATCAACPHNVWGSKITPQGKETRACGDSKRLAVIHKDDLDGEILALPVPAGSLKNLSNYVGMLNGRGVPAMGVVTTMSFDDEADFPKITFTASAWLSEAEFATAQKRSNEDAVRVAIGLGGIAAGHEGDSAALPPGDAPAHLADSEEATPKPAPKKKVAKKKAVKKAAPAPAPEPEVVEAEEVDEVAEAVATVEGADLEEVEDNDPLAAELDDILGDLDL